MAQYAETEMDKRQRERVQQSQRQRVGTNANGTARVKAKPQPQARNGDRWATFNAFMDHIAPRLTLAERAVWLVMFRNARDGMCETTVRMLATAANVSISTTQAALNRLHTIGLVRPIWKSRDRAKASRYGIHHRPSDCLHELMQHNETVPMVGTATDTNRTD